MEHTFVLCGKELQMPPSSAAFLKSYLDRVESYAKKYLTDTECVQDIQERILERLLSLPTINEKDVVRIVNEIGEPQDIFKDMEKKSGFDFSGVVQEVKNTKMWARNEKDGWILGVCAGIADALKLPVWFIRTIFVATFFAGGSSFFVYVVAAFLMSAPEANSAPSTNNENNTTTTTTAPKAQTPVQSFFGKILSLSGQGINGFFKFIGLCILLGFLFMVLCFAGGIAMGGIASLVGAGVLVNHFIVDNQDIFAAIPTYGVASLAIFGLGLLFLAAILVVSVFQRKPVAVGWYVAAILTLGLSFFTGMAAVFHTTSQYTATAESVDEYMFDVSDTTKAIALSQLESLNLAPSFPELDHFGTVSVRLEKSGDSKKIKVQVKTTVQANSEVAGKKVLAQVQPLDVTFKNDKIVFSKKVGASFKDIVPFSFARRSLVIYIPENVVLKRSDESEAQSYRVDNSVASSEMQKYHLYSCRGEDLKYDAAQQAFVCHNESEIYGRKRAADAGYMQEHFEQLLLRAIQAKGGVPNEKLTYAGSENASDYVTSSDWLSENVYAYNYKDEYLMFTLRVTITKDANGEKIYTPEVTDLVIRPTTSRDE